MVGPGRIMFGEICCKCDLLIGEEDFTDCPAGIGEESTD